MAVNLSEIEKLLLAETNIDKDSLLAQLRRLNLRDPEAALRSWCRIKSSFQHLVNHSDFLAVLIRNVFDSPSAENALLNFEHFIKPRPDKKRLCELLLCEPRTFELLMILFTGSQYLTDILLRTPRHFDLIRDIKTLTHTKSRQEFLSEARNVISRNLGFEANVDRLKHYQQTEFLRIGSADLLGSIGLQSVTYQLSNLARGVIQALLDLLKSEHGFEHLRFAVLGLGKLGGRELNYSSDIDLLFISDQSGKDVQRLGKRLIEVLTRSTTAGFFYRVDMRLRPWGSVGTLVPGLEENIHYLEKNGQIWERQAMYKARYVAGDEVLAIEFQERIRPLTLALPKAELRAEIRKMRSKTEEKLRRLGQEWGEVKSGAGSIRDVEFVTQYLQITEGQSHPEVHSRNTLDGLARLAACKIIKPEEYRVASEGYIFLRSVEHHLQVMHYRQTHLLPEDDGELGYLSRRLGFEGPDAAMQLTNRYEQHSKALRKLYEHYLLEPITAPKGAEFVSTDPEKEKETLSSHLKRLDGAYSAIFDASEIEAHANLAAGLNREKPVACEFRQLNAQDWQITIVGFDYLGELSVICGLFIDYSFDILEGSIFTYERSEEAVYSTGRSRWQRRRRAHRPRPTESTKPKIVDVFKVRSVAGAITREILESYAAELTEFVVGLREKRHREVQGEIARRVAMKLENFETVEEMLLPVDIGIDNSLSSDYTVLRIDAPDTIGFLYEFANALSLNSMRIGRVMVSSIGNRVHDTLFLTDLLGNKIKDSTKLYQLRVATVLVKHFTHLLPRSPNPVSAILHFREFVSHLFGLDNWADSLTSLERPEVLDALAKLLGVSDFLWNDFLRMQHENIFPVLEDIEALQHPRSRAELQAELTQGLGTAKDLEQRRKMLNEFKDREMFRIDMRYIQGLVPEFRNFLNELSDLAEIIVEAAATFTYQNLSESYGHPVSKGGRLCKWCVFALGKLGGRGLGFASDIELMFLYEGEGHTNGSESILNSLFFERLVTDFCHSIHSKVEGSFAIDLRLRPYGKGGSFAVSRDAFESYYQPSGPAWSYEKQALVRMRPIYGDTRFGQEILQLRDDCVYTGIAPDLAAMKAMREKQLRQLVAGGTVNAKFSPGALVDLEYLIQHLQIRHGKNDKSLRVSSTSAGMIALARAGIIAQNDFKRLKKAHRFLRILIEALRMVRGHAKDLNVPPEDSKEFAFLARRLGYEKPAALKQNMIKYMTLVEQISTKLLAGS